MKLENLFNNVWIVNTNDKFDAMFTSRSEARAHRDYRKNEGQRSKIAYKLSVTFDQVQPVNKA